MMQLIIAVALAEAALLDAEYMKQPHLNGVANKKLVVIPVDQLRALVEAAKSYLQRREKEVK